MDYIHFDSRQIGYTLTWWPRNTSFFSTTERLAIAGDQTNQIKWLTVFALGALTQIAIGLVHLERPRAQLAALALFSLAVVVVLGLIAMQEQPFAGAVQVSSAPLQEFLETMKANP